MKRAKPHKKLQNLTGTSLLLLFMTVFFSISAFADGAVWTTKMGEIEYMKNTGSTAVFSNEQAGIKPVTWFFINEIGQRLPESGSYSGYWIDNSGRQMCEASLVEPFGTKSQSWGRFEITFEPDGAYPTWTGTLGDCFKQPDRVLKASKPVESPPDSGSAGQMNYLITPNSAGDVRIGMTIAEAQQALPNAGFSKYEYEGAANDWDTISVMEGGKVSMTLATSDDGRIAAIKIWDSRYRLANGVHPKTTIADAERIYGKIKDINLVYGDREWAEFTNHPKDLRFIVDGGDYSDWNGTDPREKYTDKYTSGAYIEAIEISGETGEVFSPDDSEPNYLITADSAGDVRFGMTIGEARKILKGAKFTRDMDDGEGVIISVDQGGKSLMWLYVDEGIGLDDIETAPIVESGKIEGISIFDSRYKTTEGVHCGMEVSEAETRLGKLKNIWKEGLTANELATFSNPPKGFGFWIAPAESAMTDGQYNTAGIYGEKDPDNTTRYETGAVISMIRIPSHYQDDPTESKPEYLITPNSAGDIRLGMTIAEARKAMSGATLTRTSDGDGVALIAVKQGGVELMSLYAGEVDYDAPVNENARIENIEVWSPKFMTAEGVRAKMKVSDVEKLYGKVKIIKTELEGREFADFAGQPKYLGFRLSGPGDNAGDYPKGETETGRYFPSSAILSITIATGPNY